jgi:hypothetical protein
MREKTRTYLLLNLMTQFIKNVKKENSQQLRLRKIPTEKQEIQETS